MVAAGLYMYHVGEDGGSLAGDSDQVLQAVQLCVELGNDVNAADIWGYTALHGAAYRGLNALVEYLVEKGARLDARSNAYDLKRQAFLPAGDNRSGPDVRLGWTPLAIANGFSYSDFYTAQAQTAALLRRLMETRGLSTADQVIDPLVCHDCIGNYASARAVHLEREQKLDALAATLLGRQ